MNFNTQDEISAGDGGMYSTYISPRELAERWQCSRTSAQRIAERAGIARYLLGKGRNGMVRYARAEIEAYESSRQFRPN